MHIFFFELVVIFYLRIIILHYISIQFNNVKEPYRDNHCRNFKIMQVFFNFVFFIYVFNCNLFVLALAELKWCMICMRLKPYSAFMVLTCRHMICGRCCVLQYQTFCRGHLPVEMSMGRCPKCRKAIKSVKRLFD